MIVRSIKDELKMNYEASVLRTGAFFIVCHDLNEIGMVITTCWRVICKSMQAFTLAA